MYIRIAPPFPPIEILLHKFWRTTRKHPKARWIAATRRIKQNPNPWWKNSSTQSPKSAAYVAAFLVLSAQLSSLTGKSDTSLICECDNKNNKLSESKWSPREINREETCNCISWVRESLSTRAKCRLRQNNAIDAANIEDQRKGRTFDPATTKFFEVQLAPRYSLSSSMNTPAVESMPQPPLLHNTVVVLPDLLTKDECESIVRDTERNINENEGVKTEKWVMYHRLDSESQKTIDRLLTKHVIAFLELRLPHVAQRLFHGKNSKSEPKGRSLNFYWDDPVIIKYLAGNRLAPHDDMRELTIVVPLNPLTAFPLDGGGTRFWLEGTCPDQALETDGVSISPSAGSGILFNGDITHSGNSVLQGTRFVLMTSINLDDMEIDDENEDE